MVPEAVSDAFQAFAKLIFWLITSYVCVFPIWNRFQFLQTPKLEASISENL